MLQQQIEPKGCIIFGVDTSNPVQALHFVRDLCDAVGGFKFGFEFILSMRAHLLGAKTEEEAIRLLAVYREIHRLTGGDTLTDAKLCDTPGTVERASIAISRLQPKMFTVHASAGSRAIQRAVARRGESAVLGVTVLTSLTNDVCHSIFGTDARTRVLTFAKMLRDEGAQGLVCSPMEARALRESGIVDGMILVCPGIRPAWAPSDDQARVMTPGEAARAGVTYQVISRPIAERSNTPLVHVQTVRSNDDTIATPREAAEVIALEIAYAREAA